MKQTLIILLFIFLSLISLANKKNNHKVIGYIANEDLIYERNNKTIRERSYVVLFKNDTLIKRVKIINKGGTEIIKSKFTKY